MRASFMMMDACNMWRVGTINKHQIITKVFINSNPIRSFSLHSGGGKLVRRAYDALLLDAGGTLLQLEKPVEETYAEIGRKHGLKVSPVEIKKGFKRAFSAPWPEKLRYQVQHDVAYSLIGAKKYNEGKEKRPFKSKSQAHLAKLVSTWKCALNRIQGDGRPFWKLVVSEATGCASEDYFEEVYEHYAQGQAWRLPTGAFETMSILKSSGVKMAVVSNFDNRLRKLLNDLNVIDLFDSVIISSEVGSEKPEGEIFKAALDQVRVEASNAIHVGDDEKADKEGANAVGIDCWLWKKDVKSFADLQSRILISEA